MPNKPEKPEPAILAFGRMYLRKYTVQEYKDCLWRSFIKHKADYIVMDDYMTGNKFTAASVAWGIDEGGWLYHDLTDSSDEQNTMHTFRLTDKGKAELQTHEAIER